MISLDTIADLIRDDYFNFFFNFISLNRLFSLVVWLFRLRPYLVSFEHEVLQWTFVFNTPAFYVYATFFLNAFSPQFTALHFVLILSHFITWFCPTFSYYYRTPYLLNFRRILPYPHTIADAWGQLLCRVSSFPWKLQHIRLAPGLTPAPQHALPPPLLATATPCQLTA